MTRGRVLCQADAGLTDEQFETLGFVVAPCECGESECLGWVVIHRNQLQQK